MHERSLLHDVLGVTTSENNYRAFEQAYATLTGEPPDAEAIRKLQVSQTTTTDWELWYDVRTLNDLICERKIRVASTLFDWPAYTAMMRRHGSQRDGTAAALMIGSASALSARSFVTLAEQEYGANRTYVVDRKGGKHKTRQGAFIYADGLALPFKNGSIDFVHTNQLLYQLENRAAPANSTKSNITRLFSEIFRVRAPEGQLLMRERTPGLTQTHPVEVIRLATAGFKQFLHCQLRQNGAKHASLTESALFLNANHVYDPCRNFDSIPTAGSSADTTDIYARKSP